MKIELVKPSLEYKDSFFKAAKEWETFTGFTIFSVQGYVNVKNQLDFNNLLIQLENAEKGTGLPEGLVPYSDLWLIVDGKMAGVVNIRHNLNNRVLAEWGGHIGYQLRPSYTGKGLAVPMLLKTIDFAGDNLGIEKVMLSCNPENTPSYKTIKHVLQERGGEELEDFIHENGEKSKRFLLYTPLYYRKYASDELGLNDRQKQKFAKEAEALRRNLQLRRNVTTSLKI